MKDDSIDEITAKEQMIISIDDTLKSLDNRTSLYTELAAFKDALANISAYNHNSPQLKNLVK